MVKLLTCLCVLQELYQEQATDVRPQLLADECSLQKECGRTLVQAYLIKATAGQLNTPLQPLHGALSWAAVTLFCNPVPRLCYILSTASSHEFEALSCPQ